MSYKKIHLLAVGLLGVLSVVTLFVLEFCKTDYCYYSFEVRFGEAIFWSSSILVAILAFLLFFRGRVFEFWLKYIASWTIPLIVVVVLSVDPNSGGVLSVDRGSVALQLMIFLGGVTFIFTIGYTIITRLRK